MNRVSRLVFLGAVLCSAVSAFSVEGARAAPCTLAQDQAPLRYVRAKDAGAKLYNLADTGSLVLGTAPAKGLLAVYGEQAGYLSVEAPAGVEVWVFGQYVRALADQPGLIEITGGSVNMRPIPKSDTSAYPLEQKLHKGERVRVVGREDSKKPLAEDWLRIVAPPGTRAWVAASDTTAVDPQDDVRAAWTEATKSAQAKLVPFDVLGSAGASAASASGKGEKPAKTDTAAAPRTAAEDQSLADAEKLYETARTTPNANWGTVRAAFQAFIDQHPKSAFVEQARLRLEQVGLHEEIARIQAESSARDSKREERLRDAQRRLKESQLSQDPLWGRFQSRGILRREPLLPGQPPRYLVWWAGQPQAEIVCTSGRYDLSVFDQFEIGVQGVVLRTPVLASASRSALPGRVDATRIEVITGSDPKRN